MNGERANKGGLNQHTTGEKCGLDRWLDEALTTMPAWAEAFIPEDLSFDLRMRRQVLSCAPQVLAREAARRKRRWWQWAAVAAIVLLMVGVVGYDWRGQVPAVVAVADAVGGQVGDARQVISVPVLPPHDVPSYAAQENAKEGEVAVSLAVPGTADATRASAGASAADTGDAGSQEIQAAGVTADDARVRGLAKAAGSLPADGRVGEGRLLEQVMFAGTVDGQQLLVTTSGRAWRYVDGRLVGGEPVFPGLGEARSLMVLPGKDGPVAVWTDSSGRVHKGYASASGTVSLAEAGSARVRRLAVVPGRGNPVQLLGGVSLPDEKGCQVQLWLLNWKDDQLTVGDKSPALYRGSEDADVADLAAYRGGRGLTVYVSLSVGGGHRYYLAEWRGSRLRWQELPGPLFQPGTVVASAAGRLAGIGASGGAVSVLEWKANRGWTAWLRPGIYEVRPLSVTGRGEDVASVFFFDARGDGEDDLLLVRRSGLVGYVDGAMVSRR